MGASVSLRLSSSTQNGIEPYECGFKRGERAHNIFPSHVNFRMAVCLEKHKKSNNSAVTKINDWVLRKIKAAEGQPFYP